jgi:hypothetical protein
MAIVLYPSSLSRHNLFLLVALYLVASVAVVDAAHSSRTFSHARKSLDLGRRLLKTNLLPVDINGKPLGETVDGILDGITDPILNPGGMSHSLMLGHFPSLH